MSTPQPVQPAEPAASAAPAAAPIPPAPHAPDHRACPLPPNPPPLLDDPGTLEFNPNPPPDAPIEDHQTNYGAPPVPGSPTGHASPPTGHRAPATDHSRSHGLCRPIPAITADDPEFFRIFQQATIADLAPTDANESFLAEQIVIHRFFLFHADRAEACAMRAALRTHNRRPLAAAPSPSTDPAPPAPPAPASIPPPDSASLRASVPSCLGASAPSASPAPWDPAADAPHTESERYERALAATASSRSVHLVLRYRASHERGLDRAERLYRFYRTLKEAHARRRPDPDPQSPHDDPVPDFPDFDCTESAPAPVTHFPNPPAPTPAAQPPSTDPAPPNSPPTGHWAPGTGHSPPSPSERSTQHSAPAGQSHVVF